MTTIRYISFHDCCFKVILNASLGLNVSLVGYFVYDYRVNKGNGACSNK